MPGPESIDEELAETPEESVEMTPRSFEGRADLDAAALARDFCLTSDDSQK